jgi:hypothetical protein
MIRDNIEDTWPSAAVPFRRECPLEIRAVETVGALLDRDGITTEQAGRTDDADVRRTGLQQSIVR